MKPPLEELLLRSEPLFREVWDPEEYPEAEWDSWTWNLKPSRLKVRGGNIRFEGADGVRMPEVLRDALRAFLVLNRFGFSHTYTTARVVSRLWDVLLENGISREDFTLDNLAHHHLAQVEPALAASGNSESTRYVWMRALVSFVEWGVDEGILNPTLTVRIAAERSGRGAGQTRQDRKRRLDRLPSLEVIAALGEVYRRAEDPRDRFRICATSIDLVGGFRRDELRGIPLGGLQSEEGEDGRKRWFIYYRNLKSQGALEQYGKRWLSPLGADLVREAWEEILEITKPWRPFAAALSHSDQRLSLEHVFGAREFVAHDELKPLLGVTSRKGWSTMRRRDFGNLQEYVAHEVIPSWPVRPGPPAKAYRLSDVEHALADLKENHELIAPDGSRQTVDECLFIVPRHWMSFRPGALVFPEPLAESTLNTFFSGDTSVFARLDLRDAEGEPLSLRPHGLRHFLSTVANKAGMTAFQISIFLGRKDHFQRYDYLHDPEEYAEYTRDQLERGEIAGARSDRIKKLPTVERQENAIQDVKVSHMAGDVICVLNFLQQDCPNVYACHANCEYALYDPSDAVLVSRLQSRLEEVQGTLKMLLSLPSDPVTLRQIEDMKEQESRLLDVLSRIPEELGV